jgi:hypothetical protein
MRKARTAQTNPKERKNLPRWNNMATILYFSGADPVSGIRPAGSNAYNRFDSNESQPPP